LAWRRKRHPDGRVRRPEIRRRHEVVDAAAQEAARLRFRPIVMTSLAFVLGVLPLVVATGAGAASRHSMGTGVFGGMIAATFIAIFFIPLFFGRHRPPGSEPMPMPANRGRALPGRRPGCRQQPPEHQRRNLQRPEDRFGALYNNRRAALRSATKSTSGAASGACNEAARSRGTGQPLRPRRSAARTDRPGGQ
jgi:hypothetical protein